MINILLADDNYTVRQGVQALLKAEPDFCIVGEAGDGLEAARLVKQLHPDILVADLMMGGVNGIEVTRQVCKSSPSTNVIIISIYGNEAYAFEALRAGAKAYVLKEAVPGELAHAIREVAAGGSYLSPPLSEKSLEAYRQKLANTEQL